MFAKYFIVVILFFCPMTWFHFESQMGKVLCLICLFIWSSFEKKVNEFNEEFFYHLLFLSLHIFTLSEFFRPFKFTSKVAVPLWRRGLQSESKRVKRGGVWGEDKEKDGDKDQGIRKWRLILYLNIWRL